MPTVPKRGSCKTCNHPERARIELMCANGVGGDRVGRQFGLSRFSVWRHYANHVTDRRKAGLRLNGLPTDSAVDLEALKRNESESLLTNLVAERARLQRIADRCERVGNYQDATRASAAIVRLLELVAKYLGELRVGNTTITQNFLLSPDWFALRRLLVTSLRPHPLAQKAVLEALREHERQGGADVSHARSLELPAPIEHEHHTGTAG